MTESGYPTAVGQKTNQYFHGSKPLPRRLAAWPARKPWGLSPRDGVGAGTCELTVTRPSCRGKERQCFAKCDGKATCVRKEDAARADACLALVAKECPIARPDVTKAKAVRVVFEGKDRGRLAQRGG